jgi:ribosomal protein L19
MTNVIDRITARQRRTDLPEFRVGDTVKVALKIKEGNKERIQNFEGVVVARKGSGISETFTVRKESAGVGVKRVLPLNTPKIESLEVVKKGKVRRVKLNFLDSYVGTYKIKERGRN